MVSNYDIIAIGSSTGGPQALESVLLKMSPNFPPILIAQHMPVGYTRLLAERLDRLSPFKVSEASDGQRLKSGMVLIAAGGYHLELKRDYKGFFVSCMQGEKVNGHCPSVDVLFNSVATVAGRKAIGIILTGMGADGSDGLLNMRNSGSYTIGQDESSCIVYGMPKVAFEKGAVNVQCSLDKIPEKVKMILEQSKE